MFNIFCSVCLEDAKPSPPLQKPVFSRERWRAAADRIDTNGNFGLSLVPLIWLRKSPCHVSQKWSDQMRFSAKHETVAAPNPFCRLILDRALTQPMSSIDRGPLISSIHRAPCSMLHIDTYLAESHVWSVRMRNGVAWHLRLIYITGIYMGLMIHMVCSTAICESWIWFLGLFRIKNVSHACSIYGACRTWPAPLPLYYRSWRFGVDDYPLYLPLFVEIGMGIPY